MAFFLLGAGQHLHIPWEALEDASAIPHELISEEVRKIEKYDMNLALWMIDQAGLQKSQSFVGDLFMAITTIISSSSSSSSSSSGFYNPHFIFWCFFFGIESWVVSSYLCFLASVTNSVTRSPRMLSSKNVWWKIPIPRTTKMMMSQWSRCFLDFFHGEIVCGPIIFL